MAERHPPRASIASGESRRGIGQGYRLARKRTRACRRTGAEPRSVSKDTKSLAEAGREIVRVLDPKRHPDCDPCPSVGCQPGHGKSNGNQRSAHQHSPSPTAGPVAVLPDIGLSWLPGLLVLRSVNHGASNVDSLYMGCCYAERCTQANRRVGYASALATEVGGVHLRVIASGGLIPPFT